MKAMTIIGIILIVLGIVALAYQGFSYKTNDRVVDLGPIKADVEKEHHVPLPPILGIVALVGGIILVIVGGRGRTGHA